MSDKKKEKVADGFFIALLVALWVGAIYAVMVAILIFTTWLKGGF